MTPLARKMSFHPEAMAHETLGSYQIEAYLGAGTTSLVYSARGVTHPYQQVTLKVLRPQLLGQRDVVRAFRHEALLSQLIDHTQIVKTLSAQYDAGLYYLVRKAINPAMTLDRLILHERRAPHIHAFQMTCQLTDALVYLHEHVGIAHRDIKPSNILIAHRSSQWNATLIDLGIACLLAERQTGQPLYRHADTMRDPRSLPDAAPNEPFLLVGSPAYLPPELILGSALPQAGRDWAAYDIYALGVTVYVTLTGILPYAGRSLRELGHAIKTSTPLAPIVLLPRIAPAFSAAVMRAMNPEPRNRYASAREFLGALRQIEEYDNYSGPEDS